MISGNHDQWWIKQCGADIVQPDFLRMGRAGISISDDWRGGSQLFCGQADSQRRPTQPQDRALRRHLVQHPDTRHFQICRIRGAEFQRHRDSDART